MARRPRKVSRRKAQGSGFKGSGFRLFKVQSAVLAAQGLGFGVWGLGLKAAALDRAVSQEAAKRMSYWRWLVVDEISTVNARLLAQAHGNGAVSLAARPFFF